MKQKLEQAITDVVKGLFDIDVSIGLTRPDEQFGDYATNVALQLSKQLGKNPREVAEQLQPKLLEASSIIATVDIAGPGFLNLRVTDDTLQNERHKMIENGGQHYGKSQLFAGKKVVAEYSDPNPFKVLHAGHLYTSIIGDAIANLVAYAGGEVHRVNFGGDVGLHVGKTMWAITQEIGEDLAKLKAIEPNERSEWMAKAYVVGTNAYEDDETAKQQIIELNKRIYQVHTDTDHESPIAQIYWTCRQWSYDYFDAFYERIGTHFEKYYPESQTAPIGLATVREQLEKGVFEESNGAVIFDGDKYGLHTRVFINSEGLPTYEAKDVGLSIAKWDDYHFDESIIITGNDIIEYMKVVLKAIEQFKPELAKATVHLTHGNVKLAGGVKMSSRKGNFLRAVDVLAVAAEASRAVAGQDNEQTVLAAVKYSFLKNRMGGDIIYEPEESVSLQGNSGPYLQYAHARAISIIRKKTESVEERDWQLDAAERGLVLKMSEYPEIIDQATVGLAPHVVCTYLYELAQKFNQFYEHNRVLGDEREEYRLLVVSAYAGILRNGLNLLGITAPERM